MSWFSKHVVSPVRDFFKGPDLSGVTAAINTQAAATTAAAQSQADTAGRALDLQKTAMANATAAAMPVQDSESARVAGEDRMRKLIAQNGPTAGNPLLGVPPVGYRMLTGQ